MDMVWKDVSFRKNLNLCRFIDENVRILISSLITQTSKFIVAAHPRASHRSPPRAPRAATICPDRPPFDSPILPRRGVSQENVIFLKTLIDKIFWNE